MIDLDRLRELHCIPDVASATLLESLGQLWIVAFVLAMSIVRPTTNTSVRAFGRRGRHIWPPWSKVQSHLWARMALVALVVEIYRLEHLDTVASLLTEIALT